MMNRILIIVFVLGTYTGRAAVNAPEVLKQTIRQVLARQSWVLGQIGPQHLSRIDTVRTAYYMRWMDTLAHYEDDIVYTYRPSDRAQGDSLRYYSEMTTVRDTGFVYKIELFFPPGEYSAFKRELDQNYVPEKGETSVWLERWNKRSAATYHRRAIRLTREKSLLKVTCTIYTIII